MQLSPQSPNCTARLQDGFGPLTPQPTLGFIHNFNEHIMFFVFCAFRGRPNVLHICYNRWVPVEGKPRHACNEPPRDFLTPNMSVSESAAPACEEKARLLRLYAVAESHHQRAIQHLTWMLGVIKKPNYEDLHEFVETARDIAEDARKALDRHAAEHGC